MTTPLTPEAKLRAIIERQMAGGCDTYESWLTRGREFQISEWGQVGIWREDGDDILRILLDTEGCKAAYGKWTCLCGIKDACSECFGQKKNQSGHGIHKYEFLSRKILDSWNSGKGNNWQSALDTAYSLL